MEQPSFCGLFARIDQTRCGRWAARDRSRTVDDKKPFLFRRAETLPSEFKLNRPNDSVKLWGLWRRLLANFYTAGRPIL